MPSLLALDDVGNGEPLVLVHGIATDRSIWDMVVTRLSRTRRVVALDVPGFGGSAPVGEDFDLREVADRMVDGLAAEGLPAQFDLVGHSLGGIAITLAALHPELVRRLVLVAPAGLRPLPAAISNLLAAGADAVLAARRGAAPLADTWWGRRLLLALTAADGADLPPTLARQMIEASAAAKRTAPALATITGADLRMTLARTQMPLGGDLGRGRPHRADPRARRSSRGTAGCECRADLRGRACADGRAPRGVRLCVGDPYPRRHNFRRGALYLPLSRDFRTSHDAP